MGAATIGINSPSNTYYVGVEDATHGDYDYNDLIFSLTSNKTLTLEGQYSSGYQQSRQPSGSSQGSVDFYFNPSNNATITIALLASITANGNDKTDLYYCPAGSTAGCTQINLGSSGTSRL